jgi:predicted amidohydrolase
VTNVAGSKRYNITVCQPALKPVFKGMDAFDITRRWENVAKIADMTRAAAKEHGSKLVVFPEFCVQGYATKRSVTDWEEAGIELPGPETAEIGKAAREGKCYVAGAVFEKIAAFPGRYFMSGFMLDPEGELCLVYRKLYALTAKTRPIDIYDAYVAKFGRAALNPVADTPLGKIGCAVAGDVHWPEVTRALAFKGAELVFNPTGAGMGPGYTGGGEDIVRRARAFENIMYLAMSNFGPFIDAGEYISTARVPSEIIDYYGNIIAQATGDAESATTAQIDMDGLRKHRSQPKTNFLAQLQPQIHAEDYAAALGSPKNGFAQTPVKDEAENIAFIKANWERMVASGVFNGEA